MSDRVAAVSFDIVQVTDRTRWIFLEIASTEGFFGVGEASLQNREAEVATALRARAAALVGETAAPDRLPVRSALSLPEAAAVSAIEQALWDLSARRAGLSLARHLGGEKREKIPLYANINRRTRDRAPASFARSARDALGAGHEAFKLAPFDEVGRESRRDGTTLQAMEQGLARIAAVRDAIGGDRALMVDCHWRFEEETAAVLVGRVKEIGVVWLECPIPETIENLSSIRRLRALANSAGMRLAGCEELIGLDGFRPFIEGGAYDALMPDVKYCGGPAEMLRIADAMRTAKIDFSPHNPSGPVCHAHSLQIAAAVENFDRLEMQFDEDALFDELARAEFPPCEGGACQAPAGAGIGVALDRKILAAHRLEGWSSDGAAERVA